MPGSLEDKLETAQRYVNAINRSLRGIPRERVRLHTCYGINEGPRAQGPEDHEHSHVAGLQFLVSE